MPPYIEFRDVSKAFGDNVVLDRVSFEVNAGETVCILGRSGVGKSVSLHHIMGFLKADSGRVIVADQDITDYTEEQLEPIRKKVTMVFQNGALFDSFSAASQRITLGRLRSRRTILRAFSNARFWNNSSPTNCQPGLETIASIPSSSHASMNAGACG